MNIPRGLPRNVADTYGQRSRRRDQSGRAQAQRRFLACFAGCCNVLKASRAAKVARAQHYKWLAEDATYPARFKQAMQLGVRTLEDEAVRRAHEGVKKLVLWKGKPVRVSGELVYETEYDSNLLMFLLRAYDPKRFGDKLRTTFDANWSGNLEDLPEEFLKQVLERINAQIAAAKAKALEQAQTIDVAPAPPAPSDQA